MDAAQGMPEVRKSRRSLLEDWLLLVGASVFVTFWIVQSALDALIFDREGIEGVPKEILTTDPEELFNRVLFLVLLIAFLWYAQRASRRGKLREDALRFFDEANAVLASSLDYRITLAHLADLTVPYLADWCVVQVAEDGGSLDQLAVAHEDPEKVAWARELQERYPTDPDAPQGAPNVLRTGRSELYPDISDEMLVATSRDDEHLELMRRLGFSSAMVVPLVARGKTLGVITFVSAESGRRFGEEDLNRAESLARRAALAVDNARLYREARREIIERQRAVAGLLAAQRIARLGNWEYDIRKDRVQWSDELFRIFGVSPLEFTPTYATFFELVHPDDRWSVRREIARIRRGQEGSSLDYRIVRPDGEEISVHTEYSVVRNSSGRPFRLVGTIQDITERRRSERAIEERNEELARSNRELEQFAYVASHDLQEPLRMVSSYTQLLRRRYGGQLGEDADDFINFAVDGANRMQILINDLLAYSRVGTRGGEMVPTEAGGVLEAAKKNLQTAIEEAGAHVAETGPLPAVMGDHMQLVQLFQNLLGNAIKFCQDGQKPEVYVGAEATEDGMWLFTVRDNGIGMDPQYAERVFVIFQRLHTRSEYPGTGIGLAICKKIVERHGGKIWVESAPGEGSTFYFTLRPASQQRGIKR